MTKQITPYPKNQHTIRKATLEKIEATLKEFDGDFPPSTHKNASLFSNINRKAYIRWYTPETMRALMDMKFPFRKVSYHQGQMNKLIASFKALIAFVKENERLPISTDPRPLLDLAREIHHMKHYAPNNVILQAFQVLGNSEVVFTTNTEKPERKKVDRLPNFLTWQSELFDEVVDWVNKNPGIYPIASSRTSYDSDDHKTEVYQKMRIRNRMLDINRLYHASRLPDDVLTKLQAIKFPFIKQGERPKTHLRQVCLNEESFEQIKAWLEQNGPVYPVTRQGESSSLYRLMRRVNQNLIDNRYKKETVEKLKAIEFPVYEGHNFNEEAPRKVG